jgi:hypothetical protein
LTLQKIQTHAQLFRHIKTGAELLSLQNDDEIRCLELPFAHRRPIRPACRISWTFRALRIAQISGERTFCGTDESLAQYLSQRDDLPDKTSYPVASQM